MDPLYNTGSDFIYADDFMWSQEEKNEQMGMFDEDENRLFKNIRLCLKKWWNKNTSDVHLKYIDATRESSQADGLAGFFYSFFLLRLRDRRVRWKESASNDMYPVFWTPA